MKKEAFKNISTTQKGFTLIELMVAISIVAILSVIGFSVFSSSQQAARDSGRRTEINAIAKALEAARDFEKNVYKYTSADLTKDFPQNTPEDATYCISTNTSSPPVPPGVITTTYTACADPYFRIDSTAVPTGISGGNATTWTLCTAFERGGTPYCVQSLAR